MNIVTKIALGALTLLFIGTSPVSAQEETTDLANGAQLWADTCMRCHNARPPSDLTMRAWSFSMNHMRVRAGLTGEETRDILAFIRASKTENDKQ
ncbi:MAG TPA: cytochrome c [Sulfurovum sp.]|nr:cytochrome c [Sulfurovum sp.]